MSEKKLSICTAIFNKWNFTKSYLKDLSSLSNDHEIWLFDNGSSDETQKQLQGSKEINYIRSEVNLGYGKANNILYSYSTAPNVLFLNNDIRVKDNHQNWTKKIIEKCNEGLVSPTMGELDRDFNFIRESNSFINSKYSYMSGWCLASSKQIFNKLIINNYLGIFDERYFAYFEDTSVSFLARKLDIPFVVIDLPEVVHFGKQTSSQLNTYKLYKESKEKFIEQWKNKL